METYDRVAKQVAPMGQMGLKMFQTFMEGAAANSMQGTSKKSKD